MTNKFYIIAEEDLLKVERVMTRLHSEDRLNGDAMRDLGHVLEVVVRDARALEMPDWPKGPDLKPDVELPARWKKP